MSGPTVRCGRVEPFESDNYHEEEDEGADLLGIFNAKRCPECAVGRCTRVDAC